MALIARIQHPYIVEFKEAWVEKVRHFCLCVYVDAYKSDLYLIGWLLDFSWLS